LFGIVLFFLLAAQKGSRYVQTDIVDEVKHYDTTYYPRVLIFSIMVIALFFSTLSMCCVHLEVPLYVSLLYIIELSDAYHTGASSCQMSSLCNEYCVSNIEAVVIHGFSLQPTLC
jgi:hypothetical protein